MITKIERDKLQSLIESFYNLTGIKVAVYDNQFNEILAYPEYNSAFCCLIRENSDSADECTKSERRLCMECAEKQEIIISKCNAGLTEVVAPLWDGVSVIGYIMFGQITNEENHDKFLNTILSHCSEYGISKQSLIKAAEGIKYYSDKQLEDASKIINALSVYIVYEKLVYPSEISTAVKIADYIRENTEQDLSVRALCKKFYLSKSEIYKITKPCMPEGIAVFVKNERIKKASELLTHTNIPVWQVAEKAGFSDANYFLRVFKMKKGMSAAVFRKLYSIM